ncbi:hypothetical protein G4H71_20855 [Rhodococcus triatomae]|uniref:B-4DMT family transporter n=1 Tax=Rhodococcus triatomae TaxID=300028 RepID=A0A1G8KGX0_9NOCA|nr:B-4DMT family transporter [Rhodococcus triatomae]QNG18922.1 hypothetical protein G4H72_09525 [Rhodococcus triatomae]QNG25166.1 hypothetical protein G4H71_20855 [Rhodococcus triatomae]SDI42645.1 hypothetical protein SAMN05444695_107138 [Rhodococcus triatomae]
MNAWVVRGLGMALIHVLVRTFLGVALTQWPLQGSTFRFLGLVVVVVAAAGWGWLDAAADSRRHPEEDTGSDLTMRWLQAGVLGAFLSAVICWILNFVPGLNVTSNSLFFELTSGAAFTILLIFVPAIITSAIARFVAGRRSGPAHVSPAADASVPVGAAAAPGATMAYGAGYAPEAHETDSFGETEHHYGDGSVDPNADTTVFEAVTEDPSPPSEDAPTEQWYRDDQR